jgi:AraC-like DNA-binding protein
VVDAGSFHRSRPGGALSRFVDYFWSYSGYAPPHRREHVLPTGMIELVFRVNADGTSASGVAGPRSSAMLLDTSQPFSVIAVHFKAGGGLPFFGVPACELRNQIIDLDSLWGNGANRVRDRLWEAQSPGNRFAVLEHALIDSARGFECDAAVRYAIEEFERTNGARRVTDVVEQTGVSWNRLLARFQAEVGLTPKAFCRLRRFNAVLRAVDGRREVNWTDVALACGYFDQAHFNHDFREFTGLTPSNYLRDRVSRMHVTIPCAAQPTDRSSTRGARAAMPPSAPPPSAAA